MGTAHRPGRAKCLWPDLANAVLCNLAVMLKITLHDSSGELRFRLEGRLSGAWVAEFRQCWQTAQSTVRNRRTVVDLREVDYVDADGDALLRSMYREGVNLQAHTPLIRELVREIERQERCGRVEGVPDPRSDEFVNADPAARSQRAV